MPSRRAGGVTNHAQHRNRQDHSDIVHGLNALLEQSRIIPSVRSPGLIARSVYAPGKIVYFLFGSPEHIGEMVGAVVAADKVPIVNIDLAAGLSRDEAAISYLAHRNVQGIISTHIEPLRAARDRGLLAVKRSFLLDSAALESCLNGLRQFMPDALEIMPAIAAPLILPRLRQIYPNLPVTAGGLVSTLREIEELVNLGVASVSVSDDRLWVA